MSTIRANFCIQCGQALTDFQEEERVRRRCSAECGYIYYGNPTPVVAAVVEQEGHILLVRSHGWPEKFFGLVTGFLEASETPENGVLRELKEELGLSGSIESLIGAYSFAARNELIIAYHVRAQGEVVLGPELAAYKRVPLDKLRPWPMGTGLAVQDFLTRRNSAAK
jgi:NADH pyrophosphatase NudC (nudix superfamily)